ncbi:WRKY transcription factor WRKY24-like protein [Drosera capensis]
MTASIASLERPFSSTHFMNFFASNDQDRTRNDDNEEENTMTSWVDFNPRTDQNSVASVPNFKSQSRPAVPASPPPFLAGVTNITPGGFSPSMFLDSPLIFNPSNNFPSPAAGAFSFDGFNWGISSDQGKRNDAGEEKTYGFSFQPQAGAPSNNSSSSSFFRSAGNINSAEGVFRTRQETRNLDDYKRKTDEKGNTKPEVAPIQSFSQDRNPVSNPALQQQSQRSVLPQASQFLRPQKKSDDGYNWRKYGQKQVKGSENPRSYYKCSYPNCPTKKKVERSLDGHITEIVYKGNHSHPKPQSNKRSADPSSSSYPPPSVQAVAYPQMELTMTPETSSVSIDEDDFGQTSAVGRPGMDEENEPGAKRWRGDTEQEVMSAYGSRAVREPRVVVQTTSELDILDDGFRWRKYGQKVVKGNPNPRSYYKCTTAGCPVRKHIERSSNDQRAVITTYEGKHNHDIPAPRGSSSSYNMTRPSSLGANYSYAPVPLRPTVMRNQSFSTTGTRAPAISNQQAMESHNSDGFEMSRYRTLGAGSYMNQAQQTGSLYNTTKEEQADDAFLDSFLP